MCQFSAFQEALKHQGWDLSIPFTLSEDQDPYEYELDDREIVWILFIEEEEYGISTLVADVGKGLWYDYLETAKTLEKVLKEAYLIQPNGTIINHDTNNLLSPPFGIPKPYY